jgi:heme oxygenase
MVLQLGERVTGTAVKRQAPVRQGACSIGCAYTYEGNSLGMRIVLRKPSNPEMTCGCPERAFSIRAM